MSSDFSALIRPIVDGKKYMLCTSATAESVYQNSLSIWSIMSPSSKYLSGLMLEMKLAGATTFSYISEIHPYTKGACMGAVSDGLRLGMQFVAGYDVPSSLQPIGPSQISQYHAAIDALASNSTQDIIVLCAFSSGGFVIVNCAKEIGYSPNSWMITPFHEVWKFFPNSSEPELSDPSFLAGTTQWIPEAQYDADPYYGTPQQFYANFTRLYHEHPSDYDVFGAATPPVIYEAIRIANSTDPSQVAFSMSRMDWSYFFGRIAFKADHMGLTETVAFQYQQKGFPQLRVAISPNEAKNGKLIYPIPSWSDRTSKYGWFNEPSDIVIASLSGFAIFVTLCMGVVVFIHRDHAVMKATQWRFVLTSLLGSVFCYLSVFTWLYYVTQAACTALPWILATGFTLLYGSILLKTWRVWHLLNESKHYQIVTLDNRLMFGFLGIMLTILYAILIPWSIVSPPNQTLKQPEEYNRSKDYMTCYIDSVSLGFLIAVLIYEGFLLIVGVYFAFRIRSIKYTLFNEAQHIGFAIYNLTVFCIVCVGLLVGNVGGPLGGLWIRSASIIFAPLTTILIVFCPKIFAVYSEKYDETSFTTTSTNFGASSFPTSTEPISAI